MPKDQLEHYLRLADAATLQAKYRKRYVVAAPARAQRTIAPVLTDPDFVHDYVGMAFLILVIIVLGLALST